MAPPVAGYFAWYDASAIAGVSDGASLTAWSDGSGNGFNLGVPSGAAAPIYYKTTAGNLINGLPAVWFTSANSDGLSSAITAKSQPLTMFAVALSSTPSGAPNQRIISGSGGSDAQAWVSSSQYHLYAGGAQEADGPTADSSVHILCFELPNTGVANIYVDGTLGATNSSSGTNGFNGSFLAVGLSLTAGGAANGGFLNGALGELICYPSDLSSGDRSSVTSYLTTKWIAAPPSSYVPPPFRRSFVPHVRASSW